MRLRLPANLLQTRPDFRKLALSKLDFAAKLLILFYMHFIHAKLIHTNPSITRSCVQGTKSPLDRWTNRAVLPLNVTTPPDFFCLE